MRKLVSGWIGIILGISGFINLLQPAGNSPRDAVSILVPAIFLFAGVYYIVSAMRDKHAQRVNKWAP